MKKFAAGLFAATVVFFGMTALADESTTQDVYVGSDNSVHIAGYNAVDGSNFTTVLIREAGTTDANSVVYVDQKSDGLGSVMNFMLKDDVKQTDYTATFGNSNGDTKTINFSTGSFQIVAGEKNPTTVNLDPMYKMSVADEPTSTDGETFKNKKGDGLYKKSFVFTADAGEIFDKVYLVSGDGKTCHGYIELEPVTTNFTGDCEIAYGIQIYNISETDKGINLYLAEEEADAQ